MKKKKQPKYFRTISTTLETKDFNKFTRMCKSRDSTPYMVIKKLIHSYMKKYGK